MYSVVCISYFGKLWVVVPLLLSQILGHKKSQSCDGSCTRRLSELPKPHIRERGRGSYSRAGEGLQPVSDCGLGAAQWVLSCPPQVPCRPTLTGTEPKPNPCVPSSYSGDFAELWPWPRFLFRFISSYALSRLLPAIFLQTRLCDYIAVAGDQQHTCLSLLTYRSQTYGGQRSALLPVTVTGRIRLYDQGGFLLCPL